MYSIFGISNKNKLLKITYQDISIKTDCKFSVNDPRLQRASGKLDQDQYLLSKSADNQKLNEIVSSKENILITLVDNKKIFSKPLSILNNPIGYVFVGLIVFVILQIFITSIFILTHHHLKEMKKSKSLRFQVSNMYLREGY